MLTNRVIPILLLDNGRLVKTTKFKRPKYVGDPINAIRIFNDKEVDELVLLDIRASKKNIEPDYEMIEMVASECFMPLSYGGGIKNIDQAKKIFSLGVEKVSIQEPLMDNYNLLKEISHKFGSSSVIASIDVKKNFFGKTKIFNSSNNKIKNKSWENHLRECIESGAGEILLNSVDHDGLRKGTNIDAIKKASKITTVPLIAAGGIGSLKNIKETIDAGADAVGAGAFFVYQGPHRAILITYPKYDALEKLLNEKSDARKNL